MNNFQKLRELLQQLLSYDSKLLELSFAVEDIDDDEWNQRLNNIRELRLEIMRQLETKQV